MLSVLLLNIVKLIEGENVIEYAEKLKRIMPVSVNIESFTENETGRKK